MNPAPSERSLPLPLPLPTEAAAEAPPTDQTDRRSFLRRGLLAGAAGAGALLLMPHITASADTTLDAQMLQTAAAIENLLVKTYTGLRALPASVSGMSNPVVAEFYTTMIAHHTAHAASFNAALRTMGKPAQTGIDKVLDAAQVAPVQLLKMTDVVTLLGTLENISTETQISFAAAATPTGDAFTLFSTASCVEAGHVSALLAVGALLAAAADPSLIRLPAPIAFVSSAAGDVAFPNVTYPVDQTASATDALVVS